LILRIGFLFPRSSMLRSYLHTVNAESKTGGIQLGLNFVDPSLLLTLVG